MQQIQPWPLRMCAQLAGMGPQRDYFLERGLLIGYYFVNACLSGGLFVLVYKVVEINSVTEDELENVLNEWTAQGWRLDGVQFAMRESSRRPSMAFVTFTREKEK